MSHFLKDILSYFLKQTSMTSVLLTLKKISRRVPLSNNVLYFNSSHSSEQTTECFSPYIFGADTKTVHLIDENFKLYHDFISDEEERELMKEIEPVFKRRRYEKDHWDGAINLYKETEKTEWNETNSRILERLRRLAFPSNSSLIKPVHVLDLSKNGHIKPHVDSIKVSCANMYFVMHDSCYY